jgi:hypothetical protein
MPSYIMNYKKNFPFICCKLQAYVIVNIAGFMYLTMNNAILYLSNSLTNTRGIVKNRRHEICKKSILYYV